MPSVYLAGPIAGLSFIEANHWRSIVEYGLPRDIWRVYNPMRHNRVYAQQPAWKDIPMDEHHPARGLWLAQGINAYQADKADILASDWVLFHLPINWSNMRGTLWECGLADAYNKRMVCFPKQERMSPFFQRFEYMCSYPMDAVKYMTDNIGDNYTNAPRHIQEVFTPRHKQDAFAAVDA